jgi:hypothetical protein
MPPPPSRKPCTWTMSGSTDEGHSRLARLIPADQIERLPVRPGGSGPVCASWKPRSRSYGRAGERQAAPFSKDRPSPTPDGPAASLGRPMAAGTAAGARAGRPGGWRWAAGRQGGQLLGQLRPCGDRGWGDPGGRSCGPPGGADLPRRSSRGEVQPGGAGRDRVAITNGRHRRALRSTHHRRRTAVHQSATCPARGRPLLGMLRRLCTESSLSSVSNLSALNRPGFAPRGGSQPTVVTTVL